MVRSLRQILPFLITERYLRKVLSTPLSEQDYNRLARRASLDLVGLMLAEKHLPDKTKKIIQERLRTHSYNQKNRRLKRPKHSSLLRMLDIELTERCNLACHHCYIRQPLHDSVSSSTEMSTDFLSQLLDEGITLGLKAVRFTGGEPLIRPDFIDIYQAAADRKLEILISTNATCIDETIAATFATYKPCATSISLYGWDEKSYYRTTGQKDAFFKLINGISLLRKNKIPFDLKYPPVRLLMDNRSRLDKLAKELGNKSSLPYVWELILRAHREENLNKQIRSQRLTVQEAARERTRIKGLVAKEYGALCSASGKHFSDKLMSCRGGKDRLTVDASGHLQLCLELRHPETIYDLRNGSLHDALQNFIPPLLERVIQNREIYDRCGHCRLYRRCLMCPAVSWTEFGTLEGISEYHCRVTHCQAWLIGFLEENQYGWQN
ncbi:MAG: radical SAM protein [Patescibacteria group bacterium]|nr:radical SAM protein [Patescibacteria group bacterium]